MFRRQKDKDISQYRRQEQGIELFEPMNHERLPGTRALHHGNRKSETADKEENLNAVMPKIAKENIDKLTRLLTQQVEKKTDSIRREIKLILPG